MSQSKQYRARFGLEVTERTPVTVTIVLSVEGRGRMRDVGLVVDSVSDVADLRSEDIKQAPQATTRVGDENLLGLASIGSTAITRRSCKSVGALK